ncbi:rap guanine nucleotide exchange factor 1-like isoform X2 [Sphaeramia orbicularis]|uniref:rap guanine nucleotide exchange factor 1-like isoform X2 n=1 Tax=Sphaeramia orbicularis TaxID=375764 RepID=UPI00117BFCC7|nr:rap guanine nucleotide exchange factor 1-like isoform X2 [Sphaeramia orbicularis]
MSSSPSDSHRSQFVSLTLRLKDKLHPPRIRQTERIKHAPTQRVKPADLQLQDPQDESLLVLSERQRAVVSSLQYFKALVDRLGVDRPGPDKLVQNRSVVGGLLGGASGRVLESVQSLVQLEPRLRSSRTVSSCLRRLYESLAQLIGWADQVMLQGVTCGNKETVTSVTTVIRAVLDRAKELVRLVKERQENSAPVSPVQSQPSELEEHKTSNLSNCRRPEEEVLAPPKPPMPPMETPLQGSGPPALPPKKRHSLIPAPCRVAIVAPMIREPEVDRQEVDEESLKRFSSSSTESSAQYEEDPDYDFLRTDLSFSEPLPPLLPHPLAPPTLPEKRHCSTVGISSPHAPPSFEFEPICPLPDPTPSAEYPASPSQSPPPLPQKRKHIHQYMLVLPSSYSSESTAHFYQRPPTFQRSSSRQHQVDLTYQHQVDMTNQHQVDLTYQHQVDMTNQHQVDLTYQHQVDLTNQHQVDMTNQHQVDLTYQHQVDLTNQHQVDLTNQHQVDLTNQHQVDLTNQLTHMHLDWDSAHSLGLPPAPALPPKKRLQEEDPTKSSKSHQQEGSKGSRKGEEQGEEQEEELEEEQEEVLLTERQQILLRLTLKTEEEEGPDVKAASPDILLVYATEMDSSTEQEEFREAFLFTYRSFISTSDVIKKLRLRYSHLQRDPAHLKAAMNTFHLLVRVVDELSSTELDCDLLLLLTDLVSHLLIGGELALAHLLRSNILSKMEGRWKLIGSPQSLRPLAARGVAARPGTLLDFRSQDLAEQLTLLDSELFYKIELPEVLMWSKEQNEEQSPNLTNFTEHFNSVSFWVRSVIILQDKPQDREKLLLKFLKVMKHLRKLNNFNSYLSILSALDSAPLRRLDWQKNTSEALEEFSSLIDSSSSFRAYRAALAEVEPPCIPYLGLILQDLTFVHLGNPDTLTTAQGSKVNFSKRMQQFNILDTLRSYQQVHYSLQPNDDIISFFNDFSDHLAEEALWELSLRLRPRNVPRANQR